MSGSDRSSAMRGTATLIRGSKSAVPLMGPYVYGTDGKGAENLILKTPLPPLCR